MPGPLSRFHSNSRSSSKQRSTTPRLSPSPSPRYLPPSHYAAAAGISNRDFLLQGYHPSMDKENEEPDLGPEEPAIPQSRSSNSSLDLGRSARTVSTPTDQLLQDPRFKRRSQIGDIPRVEANLVPSLRDTITRMTKPQDFPPSSLERKSSLPFHSSRSPSPFTSKNPDHSLEIPSFTSARSSPLYSSSNSNTELPYMSPSPRTPSRTSTRPKSVLKQASRSPGFIIRPNETQEQPCVSLKTQQMVTSRGSSKTPDDTGNSNQSSNVPITTNKHRNRNRSVTDPGTRLVDIPDIPLKPPRTPQLRAFASSIPRRVNTPAIPPVFTTSSISQDSSDLESHYAQQNQRTLVVTNAVIVPSSSGSSEDSSEAELKTPSVSLKAHLNQNYRPHHHPGTKHKNVGLGLGIDKAQYYQDDVDYDDSEFLPTSSRPGGKRAWVQFDPYGPREGRPREEVHEISNSEKINTNVHPRHKEYYQLADPPLNRNASDASTKPLISSRAMQNNTQSFKIPLAESPVQYSSRRKSSYPFSEDDSGSQGQNMIQEERPLSPPPQADLEARRKRLQGLVNELRLSDDAPRRNPDVFTELEDSFPPAPRHNELRDGSRRKSRSPVPQPVTAQRQVISLPSTPFLNNDSTYDRTSSKESRRKSRLPVPVSHKGDSTPDTGRRRSRTLSRTPVLDHKDADTAYMAESVSLAKNTSLVAARERMTWGLPPSQSDQLFHDNLKRESMVLPSDGSQSSVANAGWPETPAEEESGWSFGARALIRKLSGKDDKAAAERRMGHRETAVVYTERIISPSVSADSFYEDEQQRTTPLPPVHLSPKPTSCVPPQSPKADSSLAPWLETESREHRKQLDLQREQLLYELCRAEEQFIKRLHTTIQLYVLPLRVESTRTWISGVPSEFATLLDWFEDIMNLHQFTLSSLRQVLQDESHQKPAVDGIHSVAQLMTKFIQRLEVYQPYLVQLSGVVEIIAKMMDDPASDLGQFVKMQQEAMKSDDAGDLQYMLVEPVNRLSKYPNIFRKLLSFTSREHPEYTATLCLSHSVETMIRAMTEVKIREDEYKSTKTLLSSIQGLTPSIQRLVVTRERKLAMQGHLLMISPTQERSAASTPAGRGVKAGRISRLMEALDVLEQAGHPDRPHEGSASYFPEGSSFHIPEPRAQAKTVHLFLFSDLVVLAEVVDAARPHSLVFIREIGISRVLGAKQNPSSEDSFALQLLPYTLDSKNSEPTVQTIHLQPSSDSGSSIGKEAWISALQTCSQTCVRNICFASLLPSRDCSLVMDDEKDSEQLALASVLGSGLPFPKSPSCQNGEQKESGKFLGEKQTGEKLEREARGWWDVRLRKALGDMRRREELK